MIIYGHRWINSKDFQKSFSIKSIDTLASNDIALLEPLTDSIKLAQHCQQNKIPFALTINTIKEAIFANALGAKFAICQIEDAANIQKIAQEYLFDTKVLALINNEKEIEKVAHLSIDGVIFPEAIKQG